MNFRFVKFGAAPKQTKNVYICISVRKCQWYGLDRARVYEFGQCGMTAHEKKSHRDLGAVDVSLLSKTRVPPCKVGRMNH